MGTIHDKQLMLTGQEVLSCKGAEDAAIATDTSAAHTQHHTTTES